MLVLLLLLFYREWKRKQFHKWYQIDRDDDDDCCCMDQHVVVTSMRSGNGSEVLFVLLLFLLYLMLYQEQKRKQSRKQSNRCANNDDNESASDELLLLLLLLCRAVPLNKLIGLTTMKIGAALETQTEGEAEVTEMFTSAVVFVDRIKTMLLLLLRGLVKLIIRKFE